MQPDRQAWKASQYPRSAAGSPVRSSYQATSWPWSGKPSAADLGMRVLIGSPMGPTPPVAPAPPARVARTEVTLSAAELERVVGRYRFTPGFTVAVTLEGGRLRARNEGGGSANAIFPEAPLNFFWRILDAQIRFTTDAAGTVVGAVLTQDGQSFAGTRIEP